MGSTSAIVNMQQKCKMGRSEYNSDGMEIQKNACQYCQYCQFEGHKGRKNQETDKTDKANFYIPVKMEEEIFNLSKITKNNSKILLSFTKDAKETKVRVYKKMM